MSIALKTLLSGLRLIAVFEAAKGALVLLVGAGLASLVHHDLEAVAEHIVRLGHLNPASHYPRVFIEAASRTTDGRLWAFAAGAAVYAIVRFVEAYGLWHERTWAEWFALFAGGLYLPVEIYEMIRFPTWIHITVLLMNIGVVAYMAYALRHPQFQEERDEAGEGI